MVRESARVHGFLKIDRDGVPRALRAPRVGDTYHPNQSTSKTADRTFPMVVYPGYCYLLDVVGLAVLRLSNIQHTPLPAGWLCRTSEGHQPPESRAIASLGVQTLVGGRVDRTVASPRAVIRHVQLPSGNSVMAACQEGVYTSKKNGSRFYDIGHTS